MVLHPSLSPDASHRVHPELGKTRLFLGEGETDGKEWNGHPTGQHSTV